MRWPVGSYNLEKFNLDPRQGHVLDKIQNFIIKFSLSYFSDLTQEELNWLSRCSLIFNSNLPVKTIEDLLKDSRIQKLVLGASVFASRFFKFSTSTNQLSLTQLLDSHAQLLSLLEKCKWISENFYELLKMSASPVGQGKLDWASTKHS